MSRPMLPNGKVFFFWRGRGEKRSESLQSSDLQKNVSIKDEEQTEYRFWNQRFLEPKVFEELPGGQGSLGHLGQRWSQPGFESTAKTEALSLNFIP